MFKDYNLNYHYETKHSEKYKNLTDAEWKQWKHIWTFTSKAAMEYGARV